MSFRERHSIAFLNITQSLAVINDNIYRFVMAYMLIDILGKSQTTFILSFAGATYVVPFLLFSSWAGVLADRFSKQRLVILMKFVELALMIAAIFVFVARHTWATYLILFFMATRDAIFSPSKYGIIPELVPREKVSRSNGIISGTTYLSIILGTFFASLFTEATHRNYPLIGGITSLIAFIGLIAAFGIKYTKPQHTEKRFHLFFFREIFRTLKTSRKIPHLFPVINGDAFFLFIGGYTQLNVIPFVMQSLGFSEIAGGYFFLLTAFGIAVGALIAGRISRTRIEIGLSCIASAFMGITFWLLDAFAFSVGASATLLFVMGVFGGMYIVPLDSYIQVMSGDQIRGQMIGATNFLGFVWILGASACLYFFSDVFTLSASGNFTIIGFFSIIAAFILMFRLSDYFFSFLSSKFLFRLLRFHPPAKATLASVEHSILIVDNARWRDVFLLPGLFPQMHMITPSTHRSFFKRLFYSIHPVRDSGAIHIALREAKILLDQGLIPCIVLHAPWPAKGTEIAREHAYPLIFVHIARDASSKLTAQFLTQENE